MRDIEGISLLTGGFTSALVYKICVREKHYVMRLIMQMHDFNYPVRQYSCMSIAADGGVAPRMYYSNAEDALSLSDYVVVAPHRGSHSERLVELAHLVRSIHDLPLFPPYGDFMDGIDGFIENFKAPGLLPG